MKRTIVLTSTLLTVTCFVCLQTRVHAKDSPKRIEIVAKRFEYVPGEITVKVGTPVTIALSSRDVDHGLKFKELNLEIRAKKGDTQEMTFTPAKVGDFVGQCSSFCGSGHGSMKLMLHVTE